MIEKSEIVVGAESTGMVRRGLIPVDCFRQVGEDIPAFLAGKRVSSYEHSGVGPLQVPKEVYAV